MVALPKEKLITGEELYAMAGVGPCELIDGRIVPTSPTGTKHAMVEIRFASLLDGFVRSKKLGKVMGGEAGIFTQRNPDRVRAADVLFISNERFARQKKAEGYLEAAPELVVEVLSPDDTVAQLTQKLREYFAVGVKLVWVADPDAKVVFAYRSVTDVREFKQGEMLPGDDVLLGFQVAVKELFEV